MALIVCGDAGEEPCQLLCRRPRGSAPIATTRENKNTSLRFFLYHLFVAPGIYEKSHSGEFAKQAAQKIVFSLRYHSTSGLKSSISFEDALQLMAALTPSA